MNTKFFLIAALFVCTQLGFGQESKHQLSSHILDITQGKPAGGVEISLSKQDQDGNWILKDKKRQIKTVASKIF